MQQKQIVALVGAILLAVGSLLDWATISTAFGSIGFKGTEGDGVITLAIGLVAAVLFLAKKSPLLAALASLGCLAGAAVAVYDIVNVSSRIGEVENEFVKASVGVGLWLCLVGGVVGTLFGFGHAGETRRAVGASDGGAPATGGTLPPPTLK